MRRRGLLTLGIVSSGVPAVGGGALSFGANSQLSIYGIVNRLAQGLIRRLGGREVVPV